MAQEIAQFIEVESFVVDVTKEHFDVKDMLNEDVDIDDYKDFTIFAVKDDEGNYNYNFVYDATSQSWGEDCLSYGDEFHLTITGDNNIIITESANLNFIIAGVAHLGVIIYYVFKDDLILFVDDNLKNDTLVLCNTSGIVLDRCVLDEEIEDPHIFDGSFYIYCHDKIVKASIDNDKIVISDTTSIGEGTKKRAIISDYYYLDDADIIGRTDNRETIPGHVVYSDYECFIVCDITGYTYRLYKLDSYEYAIINVDLKIINNCNRLHDIKFKRTDLLQYSTLKFSD